MDYFLIITILVTLSAVFGYINVRFFKLPNSIGLMFITILFTLAIFLISFIDDTLLQAEIDIINQIDFETVLLDVMLSFLLFAGALHTNFERLKVQRWPILAFSTLGVLVSTFLVGTALYYILYFLQLNVEYIYCLLFGALISPTEIEEGNLAGDIMSHTISLENYKLLLLQNFIAYNVVDREIAKFIPEFSSNKANRLQEDLSNLKVDTSIYKEFEDQFSIDSIAEAWGAWYVVEGSVLGGMMISK